MLVINLFGGPGSGKSTIRAGLFNLMKIAQLNCEEACEWVKQKVYEENTYVFKDQLYILAKQAKILKQLNGKVDYVITDCPLLLSLIYGQNTTESFRQVVIEEFNKYDNVSILLNRVVPYSNLGRLQQDENEARYFDEVTKATLDDLRYPYLTIDGDTNAPAKIMKALQSEAIL